MSFTKRWLLTFVLGSSAVMADPFQTHSAHQHGVAQMDVAMDGGLLVVVLHGPQVNFIGFEHAANNADEQQIFNNVIAQLLKGQWLELDAVAKCALQEATQLAEDASDDDGHQDLQLQLSWQCQQPSALAQFQLTLFKNFPHLNQLQAQWVSEKGQGAATLTADSPSFRW